MRLALSSSCVTIRIAEQSIYFHEITTALSKFAKSFWINNTLINLSTNKESWERKKFLLDIYKTCSNNAKKHNGHFLKKLLDAHTKPIKIVIENSTVPVKRVCVKMKVIEKSLHVSFDKDEKFMFWYFINHFKKHTPSYDVKNKTIIFEHISTPLKTLLFEVLNKDNILGTHMLYSYNQLELNTLFYQHIYTRANNIEEVDSLKQHYAILMANKDDSLEVIRKKYLRLVKRYHPDLHTNLLESEKNTNIQKFQKVQEAYEAIKSHKKLAA